MNSLTIPEVKLFSCETQYQEVIRCLRRHDVRPGKKLPLQCEVS